MKKRTTSYDYLLGKSRNEVLEELGDGFNFYPEIFWAYQLEEKWWGRKRVLLLLFEEDKDQVMRIKIVDYYINFNSKKHIAEINRG
ncbi:hypothetical protein CMU25_17370 [Elizabethkingia anophelis]|nr:hypothetical protein [Elizabethkingia anophelis]MDV3842093.1 hypothetical protein [Elizabethkingia anophelis]